MMYRIWALVLAMLLFTPTILFAQSATDKLYEGIQAYNEVEWEKAVTLLNEALKIGLSDLARIEAYRYLGFCYYDMGQLSKADEAFRNLLNLNFAYKLDPNVPPKYLRFFEIVRGDIKEPLKRGIDAYNNKDFQQAIVHLTNALEQESSNQNKILAHQYLALCYIDTDQISKAKSEFQKLLAMEKDYRLGNEFDQRYRQIFEEVNIGGIKTGSIFVESNPSSAQVMLDGGLQAERTPMTIRDVIIGSHRLKLALSGYKDWEVGVNVETGKTTKVNATFIETSLPSPLKPVSGNKWKWPAIVGGTAAAVGAGVVAAILIGGRSNGNGPPEKGSLVLTISF